MIKHRALKLSLWSLGCLGVILFIPSIKSWLYSQSWLGFGPLPIDAQWTPEKTFWDWMQLLIVPLLIAVSAIVINSRIEKTSRTIEANRIEEEHKNAENRLEEERKIEAKRLQETILDSYVNHIQQLIATFHLAEPRAILREAELLLKE